MAVTGPGAEQRRIDGFGRLDLGLRQASDWYLWGPYLSERQWGTVREDYSADGDAWTYFPHDHARSRAYRWGEDGLAGWCDIEQRLCLALALWNGQDPTLKERAFGLNGHEGNHGEDVKEYWWYRDAVPSHAWNTWRYHYPQRAFPYDELLEENRRRGRLDPEYELLDTGIFDDDRYWVVDVTYAKADPTDVLMTIDVTNAGPDTEVLHVLPTLWFRNTWSWNGRGATPPELTATSDATVEPRAPLPRAARNGLRHRSARRRTRADLLRQRDQRRPALRQRGDDAVAQGRHQRSRGVRRRDGQPGTPGRQVRGLVPAHRRAGADRPVAAAAAARGRRTRSGQRTFGRLHPGARRPPGRGGRVLRRADPGTVLGRRGERDASGVRRAAVEQAVLPLRRGAVARRRSRSATAAAERKDIRNGRWRNFQALDIMSMPDTWEYPWFAAWDLAFQCVALTHVDPAFAKYQLSLLCREWFQHPNGALPAYEWDFSDVNPPVQAWAALEIFAIDGGRDIDFLSRIFDKLLVNFTWWVNREDADGSNLFEGGFMGLDNIGPMNRSHLPIDGVLEQSDATGWMATYALWMAMIATILQVSGHRPALDLVQKFLEHFAAHRRSP